MTLPILLAAACLAGNLNCANSLPDGRAQPKAADVAACAHLGAGYVRAPGTDTCYKVGGSVRSEGAAVFSR